MSLITPEFVTVSTTTGVGAVVCEDKMIVDTILCVLPFGVEVRMELSVDNSVIICETGLGVTTCVVVSLTEII